ncbi:hypothetical protein L226DRAFT_522076 [Lentinus tigrinus ALCF2SS1-7]|uniref:Uncharacterized protein n=1 Tax=Lentinus tigrinus ALCF2SS1-6 TaxID=1328759 RepID=A0A5C2SSG6_9APHY|nr:hypothetical protein L227DRAFT_560995 [Lentinus tigrinus ALCF2SS1-6]RPD76495.1 hypothetical protein L226DRAFT_522076 [Lentinus tigrinus ALCF2SS1-7]
MGTTGSTHIHAHLYTHGYMGMGTVGMVTKANGYGFSWVQMTIASQFNDGITCVLVWVRVGMGMGSHGYGYGFYVQVRIPPTEPLSKASPVRCNYENDPDCKACQTYMSWWQKYTQEARPPKELRTAACKRQITIDVQILLLRLYYQDPTKDACNVPVCAETRSVMTKMVNSLTAASEIGGPMAATYLLKHPDHYTAHKFRACYWREKGQSTVVVALDDKSRSKGKKRIVPLSLVLDYMWWPAEYEDHSRKGPSTFLEWMEHIQQNIIQNETPAQSRAREAHQLAAQSRQLPFPWTCVYIWTKLGDIMLDVFEQWKGLDYREQVSLSAVSSVWLSHSPGARWYNMIFDEWDLWIPPNLPLLENQRSDDNTVGTKMSGQNPCVPKDKFMGIPMGRDLHELAKPVGTQG